MTILKIFEYQKFPDILRMKSEPVTKVDRDLINIVNDMCETMWAERGAGLSAIQVGTPLRLFIVDETIAGTKLPVLFINPEIVESSKETINEDEGCLSFPGLYQKVRRAQKIKVRAQDIELKSFDIEASDLLARVIQHEIEHLDGKIFIDKKSKFGKWKLS